MPMLKHSGQARYEQMSQKMSISKKRNPIGLLSRMLLLATGICFLAPGDIFLADTDRSSETSEPVCVVVGVAGFEDGLEGFRLPSFTAASCVGFSVEAAAISFVN